MPPLDLTKFGEYGFAGLIIGLFVWLWLSERTALKDCWKERLTETKELGSAFKEVVSANSASLNEMISSNEVRNRAVEAMGRAQELSAQAAQMQAAEIQRLREELVRARHS